MSFFKDFKEDLSMAVNELMPDEAEKTAGAGAEKTDGPDRLVLPGEKDLGAADGLGSGEPENVEEDDFTLADDYLKPEDFLEAENIENIEDAVEKKSEAPEEPPLFQEEAAQTLFQDKPAWETAEAPEEMTFSSGGAEDKSDGEPDQGFADELSAGIHAEFESLTPEEADSLPEQQTLPEEADSLPEGQASPAAEEYSPLEAELKQAFAAEAEESMVTKPAGPEKNMETKGEETMKEDLLASLETEEFAQAPQDNMEEATDENAVITEGMTITGDIAAKGSIEITGTVNGNIDVRGKIVVTGKIQGNSKAAEFYADSAKINGQIVSTGSVKVGQSSVIIGDIGAGSAVIAGAVKGDIDVQGPVILDSTAIVMGNIKSKSIQINNGAVIEGMCSQCYAEVSPTNFFDDVD